MGPIKLYHVGGKIEILVRRLYTVRKCNKREGAYSTNGCFKDHKVAISLLLLLS